MYKKCKKLLFGIAAFQFLITFLLFTPLQQVLLLPINLIEHVLGVLFFGIIGYALYGLFIKKEYSEIKFGVSDGLLVLVVLFFGFDYFNILTTPHAMFHETYFI